LDGVEKAWKGFFHPDSFVLFFGYIPQSTLEDNNFLSRYAESIQAVFEDVIYFTLHKY